MEILHGGNRDKETQNFPKIPPTGIIEAARSGKLVFFVGAGVSRLSGGPSWDSLGQNALKALCDDKIINHAEKDILAKSLRTRDKLSIAVDISDRKKGGKGKGDLYRKMLQFTESKTRNMVEVLIRSIGAPIVTTNYDTCLESAFPKEPTLNTNPSEKDADKFVKDIGACESIYKKEELTIEKLFFFNSIIHLHGSHEDPDTMVVTTMDYLGHYNDEHVREFLKELFSPRHTVLFIGYGLEEDEILQYVLRSSGLDKAPVTHYSLFPYFSHQKTLLQYLSEYYLNNFGIQIIEYCIDDQDYCLLIEILKEWTKILKPLVTPPGFIETAKLIDEVI